MDMDMEFSFFYVVLNHYIYVDNALWWVNPAEVLLYIYARNELNKLIAIATTSFLISSTKLCVDIHCIEMYYSKNEFLLLS